MAYYQRRMELREIEEAEARGESFWTSGFDDRVRFKLLRRFDALFSSDIPRNIRVRAAQESLCDDEGLPYLSDRGSGLRVDDLERALLVSGSSELVASIVEALYATVATDHVSLAERYADDVNKVLREHRVSFELINGEMVPFDSRELHVEVVAPTLRLLAGRLDWAAVERDYQDALSELSDGKPADAITDAGRALQQALELLGCEGNALGPLIRSAKSKGLLGPHDTKLTDGVESLMHWVSAERSEMGEAHHAGTDLAEDAWLAIHVVGALILRLSKESPRGS